MVTPSDAQSPLDSSKYMQPGETSAVVVGMVISIGSALKSKFSLSPFASTNSILTDWSIENSPSGSSKGVVRDATDMVISERLENDEGTVAGILKEMVSPFVLVID
jgi:hypothetical protein